MNKNISISFHESEFPTQFDGGIIKALRKRILPAKWLYNSPAQAQRWLEYHEAFSPYRTDDSMERLYQETFSHVVGLAGSGAVHVVGLGTGSGHKDAQLLGMLHRRKDSWAPPHFTAIDSSSVLVLEAILHLHTYHPGINTRPMCADLTWHPRLKEFLPEVEEGPMTRIFTAFGVLPNFNVEKFLPYLRSLLAPKDLLLVSANLSPKGQKEDEELILPQYDNAMARRWFWGGLEELGLSRDHVRLSIEPKAISEDGSQWQIQVEARATRDFSLHVFGQPFAFNKGETLQVFYSNRFTLPAITQRLEDVGLLVEKTWVHQSNEEAVFMCRLDT